jgi:hypothetical protein
VTFGDFPKKWGIYLVSMKCLLERSPVMRCCEMLGGMQRVFEIVLDYAQKRHQFGRPLSAFQAIQHYCADMAIKLECSRLTHQAAWRVRFNRGQVVFLHREKDYWLTHFIPSYFPIQDRHFYPDVFYLIDWSCGWITTQNHQVGQFARLNRSFDPLLGGGFSRVLRIHL